jgi:hypothetical protein
MKRMTIEAAVAWAVRDELPKVGADAVGQWVRASAPNGVSSPALAAHAAGSLGASVDARTNRYGVVPDFGALGRINPHPAALALGEAMLALDAVQPGGFAEWEAFDDLADLAGDAIAAPLLDAARKDAQAQAGTMARMIGGLSSLMVKRAVLGAPRGWACGEVRAEVVCGSTGQPCWFRVVRLPAQWNEEGEVTRWSEVEVDGYNAKAKRPYPEAYRKHRLIPDPLCVVMARAEWQLWRAALDVLAEDMVAQGDALAACGVEVLPSALPMRPWVEGMAAPARVLEAVA